MHGKSSSICSFNTNWRFGLPDITFIVAVNNHLVVTNHESQVKWTTFFNSLNSN